MSWHNNVKFPVLAEAVVVDGTPFKLGQVILFTHTDGEHVFIAGGDHDNGWLPRRFKVLREHSWRPVPGVHTHGAILLCVDAPDYEQGVRDHHLYTLDKWSEGDRELFVIGYKSGWKPSRFVAVDPAWLPGWKGLVRGDASRHIAERAAFYHDDPIAGSY